MRAVIIDCSTEVIVLCNNLSDHDNGVVDSMYSLNCVVMNV